MYDFRDTTEKGNVSAWRSPEAVSLDGVYIEDVVPGYTTLTVTGRESLDYKVDDEERPTGVDGMTYYGKRLPAREITVVFRILADSAPALVARFRKLANFVKGENRSIRFADEPTAHYTGTIKSIDAPDAGALNVTSSMVFYCADPYLIADEATIVQAVADEKGILKATIENIGSGIAYPIYRVKHVSENGYIGISSAQGAFEMGNVEEVDGFDYTQSEVLSRDAKDFYRWASPSPMGTSFKTNYPPQYNANGELGVNDITAPASGADGTCVRYDVQADSNGEVGAKNFYCYCSLRFTCGRDSTGVSQVILTDTDDAFLCGYQLIKHNKSNYNAQYEMKIGNDSAANTGIWKSFTFDSRDQRNNPFRAGAGACDIMKAGGRIRFYYNGKYYWCEKPDIADKKVGHVYIYLGRRSGGSNWPIMLRACMNSGLILRKDNVEKWRDVPNRYAVGTEIEVDTKKDMIKINGIPSNSEMVTGSEFLSVPPGNSEIEFYQSSWCKTLPNISVEYHTRWL
jgi:predicted phage tail component-like protein